MVTRHWPGLLLLLALAAGAQDGAVVVPCRHEVNAATVIDWTAGLVQVTGRGVIGSQREAQTLARRVAILDGYRNLAEAIRGVNVTADRTVTALASENQVVKTRVDGFISGMQVTSERVEEGPPREVVVTMVAPLRGAGGLSQVVADQLPVASPPPAQATPLTGLVLDARAGAGDEAWPTVSPALLPTITDRNGRPVLGAAVLDPAMRGQAGTPTYYDVQCSTKVTGTGLDGLGWGPAQGLVGAQPLYVRAFPVAANSSTLVVDDEDAQRLKALLGTPVIAQGRVLVLRRSLGAGGPKPLVRPRPKPDPVVVTPPRPDQPKPDQPQPDQPQPDQPKPDQPKPDQPKPDQPKPDQPKPDQPMPDQPKPDQPKPDQPKPSGPRPVDPPPPSPDDPPVGLD